MIYAGGKIKFQTWVECGWKPGRRKICAARMLVQTMCQFAVVIFLSASACCGQSFRGADIPWITYEAEDMTNTGTVLRPKYDPYLVETESSGQKCVTLTVGQFV